MAQEKELAVRVMQMVEAVRERGEDPFDYTLLESYQDLRRIAAETEFKIDIDEMLNEILGFKITRVQELAKVLAAPELYVDRLKQLKPMQLAKMIVFQKPLVFSGLEYESLDKAFDRLSKILEKQQTEPPEEQVPKMTTLPYGYVFTSEDSVFMADLEQFVRSIPEGRRIPIDEVIMSKEFEEFLRRFLFVIVMISKGMIEYDQKTRTIVRI